MSTSIRIEVLSADSFRVRGDYLHVFRVGEVVSLLGYNTSILNNDIQGTADSQFAESEQSLGMEPHIGANSVIRFEQQLRVISASTIIAVGVVYTLVTVAYTGMDRAFDVVYNPVEGSTTHNLPSSQNSEGSATYEAYREPIDSEYLTDQRNLLSQIYLDREDPTQTLISIYDTEGNLMASGRPNEFGYYNPNFIAAVWRETLKFSSNQQGYRNKLVWDGIEWDRDPTETDQERPWVTGFNDLDMISCVTSVPATFDDVLEVVIEEERGADGDDLLCWRNDDYTPVEGLNPNIVKVSTSSLTAIRTVRFSVFSDGYSPNDPGALGSPKGYFSLPNSISVGYTSRVDPPIPLHVEVKAYNETGDLIGGSPIGEHYTSGQPIELAYQTYDDEGQTLVPDLGLIEVTCQGVDTIYSIQTLSSYSTTDNYDRIILSGDGPYENILEVEIIGDRMDGIHKQVAPKIGLGVYLDVNLTEAS